MSKFMTMVAFFAATTVLLAGCSSDDDSTPVDAGAPTIALVKGDINAVQEITSTMTAEIAIEAANGIADCVVAIESPFLTAEKLAEYKLAVQMSLVAPESPKMEGALQGVGLPTGSNVMRAKRVNLDFAALMPLITSVYHQTSDHNFKVTVTDAFGHKTEQTLKCHLTGTINITYNEDADLWANTATVTTKHLPEGAKVQYRVKGAADWVDATFVEGVKYRLEPVWTAAKNDAKFDIHTIQAGTGVFASTTYEYRGLLGDQTLCSGSFTTVDGDKISNGDMSGWSKKQMTMDNETFYPITYPNAEGVNFWDSANNMILENPNTPDSQTPLCYKSETEEAACLMPRMVFGVVFAPGNMFTGRFDFAGMSGTAQFGQPYVYTARPRALKVRYKATVGLIDKVGSNDPLAADFQGKKDRSCIFVAIVDWTTQHGVTSGMAAPTGMWNPAEAKSLDEGAILGYGQQIITEDKTAWTELILPVSWYDKAAANPTSSKVSLVISCATSVRGDYLTGSTANKMEVDDFEWVY
ncbi:MAG: PCMD domain-containing protein [Alistipes sp.]